MYFPIKVSAGIGDCLNDINRYPLKLLKGIGIKPKFYYTTPTHPAREIILSSLKCISGSKISENPLPQSLYEHRLANYSHRFFWSMRGSYVPPLENIPFAKQTKSPRTAVLHTHQDGHHKAKHLTAKIWNIENWIFFINMLQSDLGFQVKIMEWDSEAKNFLLQSTSGVIDATGDGMADNCKTIRDCDLFVSVDSWTKYVANWFNTPQIIIVPDLRKNYTPVFSHLTANDVARGWFVGLLEKPSVKILGLEKQHSTYNYSLENINLLTPKAVFSEAQAILGLR